MSCLIQQIVTGFQCSLHPISETIFVSSPSPSCPSTSFDFRFSSKECVCVPVVEPLSKD